MHTWVLRWRLCLTIWKAFQTLRLLCRQSKHPIGDFWREANPCFAASSFQMKALRDWYWSLVEQIREGVSRSAFSGTTTKAQHRQMIRNGVVVPLDCSLGHNPSIDLKLNLSFKIAGAGKNKVYKWDRFDADDDSGIIFETKWESAKRQEHKKRWNIHGNIKYHQELSVPRLDWLTIHQTKQRSKGGENCASRCQGISGYRKKKIRNINPPYNWSRKLTWSTPTSPRRPRQQNKISQRPWNFYN